MGSLLLDVTIKGTLVLLATGAVVAALRGASAATRHAVWTMGMAGALALPALSRILPEWTVGLIPAGAAPTTAAGATLGSAGIGMGALMALAWALGAAVVTASMALGRLRIWWIARGCAALDHGEIPALATALCGEMGISRRVSVRLCPNRVMPMVWGVTRPVVLLPAEAVGWPLELKRDVLLHELAHVRRYDYLNQVITRLACAVHWFNPLVWMAARRLRAERERACDDHVLGTGASACDYAEHLLAVARRLRPVGRGTLGVAMAGRSAFGERVAALLDCGRARGVLTTGLLLRSGVGAACLVVPLAALHPDSRPAAGDEPPQLVGPPPSSNARAAGALPKVTPKPPVRADLKESRPARPPRSRGRPNAPRRCGPEQPRARKSRTSARPRSGRSSERSALRSLRPRSPPKAIRAIAVNRGPRPRPPGQSRPNQIRSSRGSRPRGPRPRAATITLRQKVIMRPIVSSIVVLGLSFAGPTLAQPAPESRQTAVQPARSGDRMRVEAVRIRSGTPDIDGHLDDEVWQSARWITDFIQKEPDQGQPAKLQTEIAFLFDDGALYVGARMHSESRDQIGNLMTRRDEPGNAERLIVSLDTYLDRRTAYTFAVTAAGVRLDYFHPFDNEFDRDFTFEPVWETEAEIGDDGWTAEMRIPFSQLRFNSVEELVWGLNVNRYVPSINEDSFLVLIPREETGWASRFADLIGLESIPSSRRIEIMPYLASSATFTSEALFDQDDPFQDGKDVDARVGVDFKMGLGPNLTLDAAVNPDFGQVEADPAEVNLSAFETFFDERRPFFTAGQDNFEGNGPSFFYSRRIGASPHGQAGGDFVDTPRTTTILGAAKLTGRLQSGLTVGALAAITDEEQARSFDLTSQATEDVRVEPRTSYGVLRLQQQFGEDASTIGLTMTGMKRDVDAGDPLSSILSENAFAGGLDWNKRFNGGEYELLGHAGYSWVGGDSLAIARLQQRSAHFFQRPDAGHVDFDPSRTSLSGWSAAVRGGKRSGTWIWNGGLWGDSPGFEINDVGQLDRADDISHWGNVSYNDTEPGKLFRRWNLGLFENANWNFDGEQHNQNLGAYTNYTFTNFWNGFFEHGRNFETVSDNATRGGPLMAIPTSWWVAGGIFSNYNEPTRYGIRSVTWQDGLGGWEWRVDPEFTTQPTDRLTLSLEPRYVRTHEPRQFITSRSGGLEATFGRRYIFGLIDQTEIALPLRANFSFTPETSLELYAEPFAASGSYSDIGELAEPRSSDLRVYGEAEGTGASRDEAGDWTFTDSDAQIELANPDFDVLSFRSNLVMRWEWRPGSTFFLVWQQNRSASNDEGRFVRPANLYDSLTTDGENVLAIKFTYWLPM